MLLISVLLLFGSSGTLELPESPAARAWAGVGPESAPVELERALFHEDPWLAWPRKSGQTVEWQRWGEWLAAEGRSESADPRRRAGLMSIAAQQSRWSDAWVHFERLGGAPEWAAACLPRLLPGVPADHDVLAGGFPDALPAGIVLRPAVPPRIASDPRGSLRPRTAKVTGLVIGETTLDFTITVEPSGIQIDLEHQAGPGVEFAVILPEPAGQRVRIEYVDWMRQEMVRLPLPVKLVPGEEAVTLFGRFDRKSVVLPAAPKGRICAGLRRGGLSIEGPAEGELRESASALAAALGQAFGFPHSYRAYGEKRTVSPWSGVEMRLAPGQEGLETLIEIVSRAEGFVLDGGLQ